jgi:hypothetical membrane protein
VPRVPLWGVVSAAAAPVLLVTGWTIAARLQPGAFDNATQTISALAAVDASHRWVMTAAIMGTGAAQVATAAALRPAARPGRIVLAAGGVCTMLVAAFPLPASSGTSLAHAVAAAGSFSLLAVWPLLSWQRGRDVPWALRRRAATTAGCTLVLATAVFFHSAVTDGAHIGLTERAAAILLNLWPLAVAVTASQTGRLTLTRS